MCDGCRQEAAERACGIDRYSGVHSALLVKEAQRVAQSRYTFVPDIRVNVEAYAPIEAETHEVLSVSTVRQPAAGQRTISTLHWFGLSTRWPYRCRLCGMAFTCGISTRRRPAGKSGFRQFGGIATEPVLRQALEQCRAAHVLATEPLTTMVR